MTVERTGRPTGRIIPDAPPATDSPVADAGAPASGGAPSRAGRRRPGRRRWPDVALGGLLLSVVTLALLGPALAHQPNRTVAGPYRPPGPGLPLGSDQLGRSVLERVLAGGPDLLLVAAVATVVAGTIGLALGLVTAPSTRGARWTGLALSVPLVLPPILVMLVVSFGFGSGVVAVAVMMTVIGAPLTARYLRSVAGPILSSGYVEAARAAGDPTATVLIREVAPNLVGPVLADLGSRFVGAFYLVAAAGFLGLSVVGDDNWATMVRLNLGGITLNPLAVLAPAMAIAAVTIPANLLADRALARWSR